jgi:hypothetical protein
MAYSRKDYAGGASSTTLTGGINSTDTTLTISSYSGWPTGANGAFAVVVDAGTANEEKMLCTSRSTGTITIQTRGHDGTTSSAHLTGASIKHCITATDLDEANYWVAELAAAANAANDVIIADADNSLSRIAKGSNNTVLGVNSGGTLGYTTITSAMIADGTIVAGDIADGSITSAKILDATIVAGDLADGAVSTAKIVDAGVTAAKIASAAIGSGLTGGAGTAVSVNTDGSTLEIASGVVRVKDSGITSAKILDGTIALGDLAAAVQALLLPAGLLAPYAASTAPTGWLLCDGSSYSTTTYAGLYAVIGTAFGSGSGTFKVPDLRGRTVVGSGTGTGLTARTIADLFGTETHTLTSAQIPAHSHPNTLNDPTHAHNVYVGGSGTGNTSAVGFGDAGNLTSQGTEFKSTGVTITNANNTGGGSSHPNTQPSIVTAYIIKT